ncbi:MAG: type II secretion system F family protein [Planctomycetota bacterium]|nr:type II secretion system F family protein [Planctomycetota bacterium]
MFSPQIPNRPLADLCRNLATMLDAGVPILTALRTAARNTSHPKAKAALQAIDTDLQRGEDFASSVAGREEFPPLAGEMIAVAEQTGQLPEILKHLAEHYDNLVKMRRVFIGAIAWPVFQLVAAILIIALLILILGWIAAVQGGDSIDILGWGLVGPSGAILWLTMTFGTIAVLFIGFKLVSANDAAKRKLDPILLKIPAVGGCLRSFALARFSWALALTQQTGMGLDKCLDTSLRATSNGAFAGEIPRVVAMVRSGEELPVALAATGLFPETYIQTVEVADTSGTIPETLERLSPKLEADARRSLAALVIASGVGIWLIVAAFIIFLILSLASFYIGMINDAAKGL